MWNIKRIAYFVVIITMPGWRIASAQISSPTDILQARDATLQRLAGIQSEESDTQVRQAVVESFDFEEHSRISLGKHWKKRSRPEQIEFTAIMREWTENRAVKKLLKRSEQTIYESEELIGSTKALVKTIVKYKGTKTYVEYKMKLSDGKWRIYDMIIDGASVAYANRDAFYKKIKKTSYDELVSTLREKTLEAD